MVYGLFEVVCCPGSVLINSKIHFINERRGSSGVRGGGWGVRFDVLQVVGVDDLHQVQVHEFLSEGEWKGDECVNGGAEQRFVFQRFFG